MWWNGAALLLAAAALGAEQNQHITPMQKVIDLLQKLQAQVIEEGKKEEVMYKKFEDYCEHEFREKFYLASKGATKYKRLNEKIDLHESEAEAFELKVADQNTEIKGLKEDLEEATTNMNDTSKENNADIDNLKKTVSMCERALEQVKGGNVTGTFLQSLASSSNLIKAAVRLNTSPQTLRALTALLTEPGKPHAYEFHSKEVVQLLEQLIDEFKKDLKSKENEEISARGESQMVMQALNNQIDAATNKRDEYDQEKNRHNAAKEEATEDRDETQKNLSADVSFAQHLIGTARFKQRATEETKDDLVAFLGSEEYTEYQEAQEEEPDEMGEWGEKEENFKQRKETREDEVKALTAAIGQLKGSAHNYSANKRLTASFVAKNRSLAQSGIDVDDDDDEPLSFLQKANKSTLMRFLRREARFLRSPSFSALALSAKAELRADHFGKVRQLIVDLIKKLEDQLASEEDQKSWCDEQLTKTNEERKDAKDAIETAQGNKDNSEANRSELQQEIADLEKAIAEQNEAKVKASKLRAEEKEDNDETVASAKEGLAAVKQAIDVLKEFYNPEFLQKDEPVERVEARQEWRATGADAAGSTSGDTRPDSDVFENEYEGKKDEGGQIVGILEVIRSDYERTIETVEGQEKDAAKQHEDLEKEIDADVKTKGESVTEKDGEVKTEDSNITTEEGNLKDEGKNLKTAQSELNKLKPLCSSAEAEGMKNERRKRREQEVKSLRQALEILREFD